MRECTAVNEIVRRCMKLMELTRLEEALCASSLPLDELSDAGARGRQEEFVSSLAHELQIPFNNMRNALRIWRASEGDDAARGYAAGILDRQLREAIDLINDLVELERIGSGRIEVQHSRVDLAEMVTDAVGQLGTEVLSARQTIALNLPDHRLHVRGDAKRLQHMLAALIAHSARFADDDDVIDVTLARAGSQVELRIVNHAAGVVPQTTQSNTGSSILAHDRPDRHLNGHVGLALARRLAELQGGTVEVHGGGAGAERQLSVRLPLFQESRAQHPASASRGAGASGDPLAPVSSVGPWRQVSS
jgi:signal transduction histidine kinase